MANVTITTTPAAPLVGGTAITVNFAWNTAVTGFTSADVQVTDTAKSTYTKGTMQGSGQNWTMALTLPNITTTLTVQVKANAVTQGNTLTTTTFSIQLGPPTITVINKQTLIIGTTDYQLEVAITGNPTRVYAEGQMEGFYQNWDATRSVLQIKSVEVTRLITGATWKISAIRGSHTVTRKITYDVIPAAPIITDPGNQTLYRGSLFHMNMPIANHPAVARGSGLLSGLKYQAIQGESAGIVTSGILPKDAVLTESSFNAAYYAENDGGKDNLTVAFKIETHDGVYVYGTTDDKAHKIGPDAATLHWSFSRPSGISVDPDPMVVTPDGTYLFYDSNNNAPDRLLKVSPTGQLLWTFAVPTSGNNNIIVTVNGVYVYSSPNIHKVHPVTGALLWSANSAYNSLIVHGGDVLIFSNPSRYSGRVTKIGGADGLEVWQFDISNRYGLMLASGDGIYLRSSPSTNNYRFYKINAETGTQVWQSASFSAGSLGSSPRIDNSGIYVEESSTRRVAKINLSDGTTAWTFTAPFQATARFIVEGDGVYVQPAQTTNARLLKINKANGTQAWLYNKARITYYAEIYPNGIYFRNGSTFWKVDPATGTESWTNTEGGYNNINPQRQLVEDGSDLYLIFNRNKVLKLNVANGNEQWHYTLASSSGYSDIAVPEYFKDL